MKRELRFFFKDHLIGYPAFIALLSSIVAVIWFGIKIKPTKELIFLHSTRYLGVDLIGQWHLVYFLPLGSLLVLLFNVLLGYFLAPRDKILTYLLTISAAVVAIILLIQSVIIVRLNL